MGRALRNAQCTTHDAQGDTESQIAGTHDTCGAQRRNGATQWCTESFAHPAPSALRSALCIVHRALRPVHELHYPLSMNRRAFIETITAAPLAATTIPSGVASASQAAMPACPSE